MSTPRHRPICGHCGSPYGQRAVESQTIRWPVGEEMPPYRGNGKLMKVGHVGTAPNRADVRGVTMMSVNPQLRERQEADLARVPEHRYCHATIWTWDGETWHGGYAPFCTLRCALDYARQAYARSAK